MTPLEKLWNTCAAEAGYAGSEFFNNPERVFREIQERRDSDHNLIWVTRKQLLELRRKVRQLEGGD